MSVVHHRITLQAKHRGFHLVTREVMSQLPELTGNGLLQLFIQHTSAALTINENADPDVRTDFEVYYNEIVREDMPGLRHTLEGPDDMPAHIKTAFTGTHVSIPFQDENLLLGTWQGIYLCEFRNHASGRSIIASIQH